MSGGYDAISRQVNESIAELPGAATFADLAGIDRKLGLLRGTSWEMGGFADYFAFEEGEFFHSTQPVHSAPGLCPSLWGCIKKLYSVVPQPPHPLKTQHLTAIYKCNKVSLREVAPVKTEFFCLNG